MNTDIFDSWWVYLHNRNDRPSGYDWNAIEVQKNVSYSVTFGLNSYHLLKSPYKTDCKHYERETQFKSRKDCIRKCKLRISQTECGVISHEVDVYRGEQNVRFVENDEQDFCVNKLDLRRKCVKICSNYDCFKEYIVPKIVSLYKHDHCEISITVPTKPLTTYRHKPRIESIEFVCYIASALSLWFGFSVFSLYDWSRMLYKKTKLLILKKPIFKTNVLIVKNY